MENFIPHNIRCWQFWIRCPNQTLRKSLCAPPTIHLIRFRNRIHLFTWASLRDFNNPPDPRLSVCSPYDDLTAENDRRQTARPESEICPVISTSWDCCFLCVVHLMFPWSSFYSVGHSDNRFIPFVGFLSKILCQGNINRRAIRTARPQSDQNNLTLQLVFFRTGQSEKKARQWLGACIGGLMVLIITSWSCKFLDRSNLMDLFLKRCRISKRW